MTKFTYFERWMTVQNFEMDLSQTSLKIKGQKYTYSFFILLLGILFIYLSTSNKILLKDIGKNLSN